MTGPHHLVNFDIRQQDIFLLNEEIYRRCPFAGNTAPRLTQDMFLDIRWDEDLMKGLSVLRSMFAFPQDALWSPIEDSVNKKCHYQEKTGMVFKSKTSNYPINDSRTGITFKLIHSPIACNVSHCDLMVGNLPTGKINKTFKRDVKAFLASHFSELDGNESLAIKTKLNQETKIDKSKLRDEIEKLIIKIKGEPRLRILFIGSFILCICFLIFLCLKYC